MKNIRHLVFLGVILLIGVKTSNSYQLQLLTIIGINTLLALGLNMLMGYAGQISLGHAAFYGIGAYTTAILTANLNWSPWLALPAAVLLTALVAFLASKESSYMTGQAVNVTGGQLMEL